MQLQFYVSWDSFALGDMNICPVFGVVSLIFHHEPYFVRSVGEKRELDTDQSVFFHAPTLFTKSAKV